MPMRHKIIILKSFIKICLKILFFHVLNNLDNNEDYYSFNRWNSLLEDISEQLHSSKTLLQLWQKYKDFYIQCSATVQQQEDRTNQLLKTATNKDIGDDEIAIWIQDCSVCTQSLLDGYLLKSVTYNNKTRFKMVLIFLLLN